MTVGAAFGWLAAGAGVVAGLEVLTPPEVTFALGLAAVGVPLFTGGVGVGYFDLIGVAVGVPGGPLVVPGCLVTRGALAIVTMVASRI